MRSDETIRPDLRTGPYEGAGHGFTRAGEAPDAGDANRRAREQAWDRFKKLLQAI